MQGEAAMVAIAAIDSVPDQEIIALFNQERRNDYQSLGREVEEIARKLNALKKGGHGQAPKAVVGQLDKLRKAWSEVQRIDFFAAPEGAALHDAITRLQRDLEQLGGTPRRGEPVGAASQKEAARYQGRVWATRPRPFVDRMTTAWLITAFVDPQATFMFVDEAENAFLPAGAVLYGVFGGEFTHCGELCTFEVMVKAFAIKDKAVRQIAEIVHDLDIKDRKYQAPEASGIEEILTGIRKTATHDHDCLERGMKVFALLYAAKKT